MTTPVRQTRQKRAVRAALGPGRAFVSAQDLHATLREQGERIGLATVYSQLRALADSGEVDTLRSADGETLYRLCASEGHHHHLLCRSCGTTVELDAPTVEAWADAVAADAGFSDVAHTLEIIGTCATCRQRR